MYRLIGAWRGRLTSLEEAAAMLYIVRDGAPAVEERVGTGSGATDAVCSTDSTSAGESSELLAEAA